MTNVKIRNSLDPRPEGLGQTHPSGESATKQSFKDECDINSIMAKYQRSGLLDHVSKYAPQYGEYTQRDLLEAYEVVERAQEMFDDLPSRAREAFKNDPGEFLRYMEDPQLKERAGELLEMGLIDPKSEVYKPQKIEEKEAPQEAPKTDENQ